MATAMTRARKGGNAARSEKLTLLYIDQEKYRAKNEPRYSIHALAETMEEIKSVRERTKRREASVGDSDGRSTRYKTELIDVRFSGHDFLEATIDKPAGWTPKHLLDIPPFEVDEYRHALYSEFFITVNREGRMFQSREQAMQLAAKFNSGDHPGDWSIVVEVGELLPEQNVMSIELTGRVGFVEPCRVKFPVRMVYPTAEEAA
ncbi:MAG TPA: hypothetical protein VGJ15_06240, partial [Pirellulales bacterium]